MTTDNWQQFKQLFQAALELPLEERSAYLDRVCTEPSARAEVEALLLCYGDQPGKVASRNAGTNADAGSSSDPLIETFIDHYQIIQKLGEFGPAIRYLALRLDDPGLKQVVLEVVGTQTPANDLLRSFQRECRVLRNLRHPNLASFLDSGATRDGLPYLVTEYIEGVPVEQYCDSNKLSTRDRTKLFLDICDALQYAHQHFIPHACINSNAVLVTKEGIPKLLNLGIGNLLTEEARVRNRITESLQWKDWEYLAPEQMRGEPITTTGDVYALGVLLYRLLTGHSPYRMTDGTRDELVPAIFEAVRPSKVIFQSADHTDADGKKITVNPALLSGCRNENLRATSRSLKGDFDRIVLRAIQKNSLERYASVTQLAEDIQCCLNLRPIPSRKGAFIYRCGKFIRRHMPFTIAACLVLAVLATYLIMFTSALRR
jgi:serine/threonine protein kinase